MTESGSPDGPHGIRSNHLAEAVSIRGLKSELSAVTGFNATLATFITSVVGTMWCAYAFGCLALIGLPPVLGLTFVPQRFSSLILWVSSEFLQLVLLSVIMVGQAVQGKASDARAIHTYEDTQRLIAMLDLKQTEQLQELKDHIDGILHPAAF